MHTLPLCLLIQLFVIFGCAGLFWPNKLMPLFDVLMYPWAASMRAIRANSLAAIAVAVLLFVRLVTVAVH